MIPRYTHPEMGRIWSEQRRYETWLQVEVAAAEAMADGRHHALPTRLAISAASGGFRHRAHRGNREGHAARRHRLYDRGRRARRPGRALAAFRPDLVGCRRYRAGHPDARGLRCHPGGSRGAAGRDQGARTRTSPHANDRPHARRACRADDVWLEAGALVCRDRTATSSGCNARARSSASARSPAPLARSRTSIRRSKRRSARGWACSRRRFRRKSFSAIGTPSC